MARRGRRPGNPGTCSACHQPGHTAVGNLCSATSRAVRLVLDGGLSRNAAARKLGIRPQGVHEAVARARKARSA